MRLDRNISPGGEGKYALVKMRKITAIAQDENVSLETKGEINLALQLLNKHGLMTYGDESPGDQFFVMKHKDCFTAPALRAYRDAVLNEANCRKEHGAKQEDVDALMEYAADIDEEMQAAERLMPKVIPT